MDPIHYPNAIWDEDEQRLVSDAEVAEVPFTALHLQAQSRPHQRPADRAGVPSSPALPAATTRVPQVHPHRTLRSTRSAVTAHV